MVARATPSGRPQPTVATKWFNVGRTFIFGRPSGTVSTWPESFCPLRVADGHRWPYTTGHTWRPTDGQGPVTACAPWPHGGRTRTTCRTLRPACYIGRAGWPAGDASGYAPDRSHLQHLTAPTSCVSARPPRCWPRPSAAGHDVSAPPVHWPLFQPDTQLGSTHAEADEYDNPYPLASV